MTEVKIKAHVKYFPVRILKSHSATISESHPIISPIVTNINKLKF